MYTNDLEGRVNNYAIEPFVYSADYPSVEQQRRYALQGGFAILLVTSLFLAAFAVS